MLRKAFDYAYDETAGFLQPSRANTRQIVNRARKRLSAERSEPVDPAQHRRLLEALVTAARDGTIAALEDVLSADAADCADGNGTRGVPRPEVVVAGRVTRISAFARKFFPEAEYRLVEADVEPCLLPVSRRTVLRWPWPGSPRDRRHRRPALGPGAAEAEDVRERPAHRGRRSLVALCAGQWRLSQSP
ncbi:hypothetical protein [Streptomyces sp. TRM68416]|uniref:hypothetical protein n=1 Tax=Streptomyces sp. TRM68416 TaxID=2758412 RepID=UPI001CB73863|nr:hypothetical protein [Streptomyces sp. TRM68416]